MVGDELPGEDGEVGSGYSWGTCALVSEEEDDGDDDWEEVCAIGAALVWARSARPKKSTVDIRRTILSRFQNLFRKKIENKRREGCRRTERSAKILIYRISSWRETHEHDHLRNCGLIDYAAPSYKASNDSLVLTRP